MPVEKILNELKKYNKISSHFTTWRHISNKSGIYEEFPEWTVEKIATKVGINARHIAAKDETAGDMAEHAAVKLFDEWG